MPLDFPAVCSRGATCGVSACASHKALGAFAKFFDSEGMPPAVPRGLLNRIALLHHVGIIKITETQTAHLKLVIQDKRASGTPRKARHTCAASTTSMEKSGIHPVYGTNV